MAEIRTLITERTFAKLSSPMRGLRVSRARCGYANTLLIQLGKVDRKTLFLTVNGRRSRRCMEEGQASLLIEPAWRVEKFDRIVFTSNSSNAVLARRMRELTGRRIRSVQVDDRTRELHVELEGRLWIRSFAMFGAPGWLIGLCDRRLFPREKRWHRFRDHSPLVTRHSPLVTGHWSLATGH